MKLCANISLMYAGLPLDRALAQAAADGFTAVEILFPYDTDAHTLARQLQAHNLTLALINTPLGPEGEKGLAAMPGRESEFMLGLDKALAICKVTACPGIHVMAGCPGPEQMELARTTLLNNLQNAAHAVQNIDVTLTLEALNRCDVPGYMYSQPQQILPILQTLGANQVRLQFDFYHTQKEGLNIAEQIAACADAIHHVQFASPAGRHEPDLQDPDVQQGLLALQKLGYTGWLGCEYLPAATVSAGLGWRTHFNALLNMEGTPS